MAQSIREVGRFTEARELAMLAIELSRKSLGYVELSGIAATEGDQEELSSCW